MSKGPVDLNADMGEYRSEAEALTETALMALVSSCSIACGGHAGDEATMRATLRLAKSKGVAAGAHPAYPDRRGFGRHSLSIRHETLAASLRGQIGALAAIAGAEDYPLNHLKPHGALYNDAARDPALARLVVEAANGLPLYGPPGSALHDAAIESGGTFIAEGFADRRYLSCGALSPRSRDGAVLSDPSACAAQALALVMGAPIVAADEKTISLRIDTICIHSDTPGAVRNAEAVRARLEAAGYAIQRPAR